MKLIASRSSTKRFRLTYHVIVSDRDERAFCPMNRNHISQSILPALDLEINRACHVDEERCKGKADGACIRTYRSKRF